MTPKHPRCRVCQVRHRTLNATARCIWSAAVWVRGEGPYALLAHCNVLSVTLWPTLAAAEESREWIDQLGCGHQCSRKHEVVLLDAAGPGPIVPRRLRR